MEGGPQNYRRIERIGTEERLRRVIHPTLTTLMLLFLLLLRSSTPNTKITLNAIASLKMFEKPQEAAMV